MAAQSAARTEWYGPTSTTCTVELGLILGGLVISGLVATLNNINTHLNKFRYIIIIKLLCMHACEESLD